MMIRSVFGRLRVISALIPVVLFATSARAQDSEPASTGAERDVAVGTTEDAFLRARILRLEEQQTTLLNLIRELQRPSEQPVAPPAASRASGTSTASPTTPAESDEDMPRLGTHYDDGFVLIDTTDVFDFPFRLRFNDTTQFRYTNTQPASGTFTDHLDAVPDVNRRNDCDLNRNLFFFNGFVFGQAPKTQPHRLGTGCGLSAK